MNGPTKEYGTTLQINLKLLWAFIMFTAAYLIWPDNAKWWAFGLFSILMCLGGAGLMVDAIKAITELYEKRKTFEEYQALGKDPTSAEFITIEQLEDKGMF